MILFQVIYHVFFFIMYLFYSFLSLIFLLFFVNILEKGCKQVLTNGTSMKP